MLIKVFGGHTIPEIAGKGPHRGAYNSAVCDLVVYQIGFDPLKKLWLEFNDKLKHPRLASFLGIVEPPRDGELYIVYAFESTFNAITELNIRSNDFGVIRSFIRECLMAIEYVHSAGYEIEDLESPDSYLFSQVGQTVFVKLKPYKCKLLDPKDVVGGCRRKTSNIRDFSRMMCSLFFGPKVGLPAALAHDPDLNYPPIQLVPKFCNSNLVDERAYAMEIVHFLRTAYNMSDRESPARSLKIEPVLWDVSKRSLFFVAAYEHIDSLTRFEDFKSVTDKVQFRLSCPPDWSVFHEDVRLDLNVHAPAAASSTSGSQNLPFYTTSGKQMFQRGSFFDFLRCSRNLVGHGHFKTHGDAEYMKYDRDIAIGFDMMVSAKIPHFLISLFLDLKSLLAKRVISGRNLDRFFIEGLEDDLSK